jgi:hypothetical protein
VENPLAPSLKKEPKNLGGSSVTPSDCRRSINMGALPRERKQCPRYFISMSDLSDLSDLFHLIRLLDQVNQINLNNQRN